MEVAIWLLVIFSLLFLISYFRQIKIKNRNWWFLGNTFKFGEDNDGINSYSILRWMESLRKRQAELEKKGKPYLCLHYKGEWIGSRLYSGPQKLDR